METLKSSRRNLWRFLITTIGLFVGALIVHQGHAQELDQSLLWKIEGKGIQPSYLYGTFHLLAQNDFELKKKVTTAFKESEQIVLEIDMDDPNMEMKVRQNASMSDGRTLDELLTEEQYAVIDRVLISTIGQGIENFNTMKPVMLTSLLLPSLLDGRPASYESTFVQMANEDGKEVLGLESVREQMLAFDQVSYEDQISDVLEIVNQRDEMKSLFGQMVISYQKEDVNGMYDMIEKYMDGEGEFQYLMLERNKNWISRIGKLAKDKKTFFGVGAGHLGGADGVVNLLRNEGYTLTPVF